MLGAVRLGEGCVRGAIPPSLTMNNNLSLQVIKGDKRCPPGQASPLLSKATITQSVYTWGEIGSSHTSPGNIMAIDLEWTRREPVSLYLLQGLVHVSFYLPALMQRCTLHALFSAAWKGGGGGASDAFVSAGEPRQGDALFTDDLTSAVCYHRSHKLHGHNTNTRTDTQKQIPMHPPRCTLIMHIYVCKHTVQMNAQTQTHTHRVYLTLLQN